MRVIDALAVPATPEIMSYMGGRAVRDRVDAGIPEEVIVAAMNDAGVDLVIVPASRGEGPPRYAVPPEAIHRMVGRNPGRLAALAGVNVHDVDGSLGDAYRAIQYLDFRGLQIYPHWNQLPPNAEKYDVFYRAAVELRVPVAIETGFCGRRPGLVNAGHIEAVQRHDRAAIQDVLGWFDHPAFLDDVCRRHPDLRIVATHTGWPWTDDLVALARVHPSLTICTNMHYPARWDRSLLDFLATDGRNRVLWGTNYPQVGWSVALAQVRGLGLSEAVVERLLGGNAAEVYGIG